MPDPHYADHIIDQLREDFRRLDGQYREALDRLAMTVEGLREAVRGNDRLRAENERLRAELAKRNKGETEIDEGEDQEQAEGPQA